MGWDKIFLCVVQSEAACSGRGKASFSWRVLEISCHTSPNDRKGYVRLIVSFFGDALERRRITLCQKQCTNATAITSPRVVSIPLLPDPHLSDHAMQLCARHSF